jgi:hypothetical protein
MTIQKTFCGIGSRTTPTPILNQMMLISALCHCKGYHLNSGGADGADTAFEDGMLAIDGGCNIFLPWPNFNNHKGEKYTRPKPEAYPIAATLHPAWTFMKPPVKALLSRNIHQVLGWSLNDPVDFVVCYTKDGAETSAQYTIRTGGTGIAIQLADKLGIPVFNLCNEGRYEELIKFLEV